MNPTHRRGLLAVLSGAAMAAPLLPPRAASRPAPCPVASLWPSVLAAIEAKRAAGDLCVATAGTAAHPAAREADDEANGRVCALEEELPWLRAASLEGAMIHVALANSAADWLAAVGDDEEGTAMVAAQLRRLLYSVRGILQNRTGQSDAALAGRYFMAPDLDPFARVQDESDMGRGNAGSLGRGIAPLMPTVAES